MREDEVIDADEQEAAERAVGQRSTKQQRLLRLLLVAVIVVAFAGGVCYVVLRTDLLAPILAYVPPVKDFVAWCVEDPRRAWGAAVVFLLSNLGILAILEEHLGTRL